MQEHEQWVSEKLANYPEGRDSLIRHAGNLRDLGLIPESFDGQVGPFAPPELEPRRIYSHWGFEFDSDKRTLLIDDQEVHLRPTEARLLAVLADYSDRALPKDFLIGQVWGAYDEFRGRDLKLYIWYLRKKLANGRQDFDLIKNIRGSGYKLIGPTQILAQQGDQLVEERSKLPKEIAKPIFHHEYFDFDEQESNLIINEQTLRLNPKEKQIMSLLTGNRGRVLSYDFLGRSIWKRGDSRDIRRRLKFQIFRLRKMLSTDQKDGKEIITTVSLGGYRLI